MSSQKSNAIGHSTPVTMAILIVVIGAVVGVTIAATTVYNDVNANTASVAAHDERLKNIEIIQINQQAQSERMELLINHVLEGG